MDQYQIDPHQTAGQTCKSFNLGLILRRILQFSISIVSQKFLSYIFNRCRRFLYLAGPIEGGLFRRPQHNFQSSWNAPKPVIRGLLPGRKGYLRASGHLLGLCWVEFQGQAAVPWNEAGFCGSLKRPPTTGSRMNPIFLQGTSGTQR